MGSTRLAANAILVILTFFIMFAMFIMKNHVQNLEKELAVVNRDIESNIQRIHVLKAEWSYLNRPSRIRDLAQRYTPMKSIESTQIVNYSALPFKYENPENARRVAAPKSLSAQAERNRNLKHLVKAEQ